MINWQTYELLKKDYVKNRSKESLKNIRYYLDMHGYRMPKPEYLYRQEDRFSWKYLKDGKLNPDYIYGWRYKLIEDYEGKV